ncbi:MAG: hypothetical protein OXT05_15475 [Chloroflexota bacterium]|nr:hypothetical protein [Chloroflexota bacterium]
MPAAADVHMQDLLDAITTGLQNGDGVDSLIAQSDLPQEDADDFVEMIQALQTALTPLEPREEFSTILHADLLEGESSLLGRLRGMPARVHVAAFLAIFFGFVLFALRRLFGSETAQDMQEEAVVTPL